MFSIVSRASFIVLLVISMSVWAEEGASSTERPTDEQIAAQNMEVIDALDEPLYSPFVERYVLDELRLLRSDMALQKHELMQQVLDREHRSVDRGVAYATDTITYFFYLIAAASSILVIVGWTSIREIKERVHSYANDEITKLVSEYERRLEKIEKQILIKTQDIEENREGIEVAREVQSLWMRSQQELNASSKIRIYDQIIAVNPDDVEAYTYKADAVLEMEEPQWAINLCQLALEKDPDNAHAFFQLACAHATLNNLDEALRYTLEAYRCDENYREEILKEELLKPLWSLPEFNSKFS
ncbi:tetratricopeptide repeat protein [Reinekea sp.]|jgi:tetratricopeptide (TPR) repeat protein|uniref:tetratricopeptide repeat protein n=1 Tax=Reinekea sp. TaxID=1970455 RepID=UPI003988ED0B